MKTITATFLLALAALLSGCSTSKHMVLASTGTVIGLEIAQNPSTQMYQAKLGYDRAELALIPSNRASGGTNDVTTGGGASDVADVVMELHYNNIFSMSTSGIYQRLAVGKNAVNAARRGHALCQGQEWNTRPECGRRSVQSLRERARCEHVRDDAEGATGQRLPAEKGHRAGQV
jgi:hypothetical protein